MHVSLRRKRHRMLGNGSNFISRIHVDGSAIRRLLGVTLRYPSYREGTLAALAAEEATARAGYTVR